MKFIVKYSWYHWHEGSGEDESVVEAESAKQALMKVKRELARIIRTTYNSVMDVRCGVSFGNLRVHKFSDPILIVKEEISSASPRWKKDKDDE